MVLDAGSLWDWGHMRTRMSIWAELPEVHTASGLLHSEWLNHAASEVLQQQTYQRIPEAVGVHLRGGDFQRACRSALNQFVSLLFVCIETDTQAVISLIERVRRPGQPVFVSTNFKQTDDIIVKLKAHYGPLYIDDQFNLNMLSWNNQTGEFLRPILSHRLLTMTDFFIGNFFSSYSSTVIWQRQFHRYFNMPTRWMTMDVAGLLFGLWAALVLFVCWYWSKGRMRLGHMLMAMGVILVPLMTVKSGLFARILILLIETSWYLSHAGYSRFHVLAGILGILGAAMGAFCFIRRRRTFMYVSVDNSGSG
jgi:hypothetical protein